MVKLQKKVAVQTCDRIQTVNCNNREPRFDFETNTNTPENWFRYDVLCHASSFYDMFSLNPNHSLSH